MQFSLHLEIINVLSKDHLVYSTTVRKWHPRRFWLALLACQNTARRFSNIYKRYFTITWVTRYIYLQSGVHMFWFWHSESFLNFPGDLSSVNSWIWRSTCTRKSDLFIGHDTREKNNLAAKVSTGVCLPPPIVPLQLAKSFQNQMALILFIIMVQMWFGFRTRFFVVSTIEWSDIGQCWRISDISVMW